MMAAAMAPSSVHQHSHAHAHLLELIRNDPLVEEASPSPINGSSSISQSATNTGGDSLSGAPSKSPEEATNSSDESSSSSLRPSCWPVALAGSRLLASWAGPFVALFLLAVLSSSRTWADSWSRPPIALLLLLLMLLIVVLRSVSLDWQLSRTLTMSSANVHPGLYFVPTPRNDAIAAAVRDLAAWYERNRTRWLWQGDYATLGPFLLFNPPPMPFLRFWLRVPTDGDGERIALDWAFPDGGFRPDRPVLLVLHGLNGGSREPYVLDMVREATVKGWTCVVMVARGLMDTRVEEHLFHGARLTDVHETVRLLQRTAGGQRQEGGGMGAPVVGVGFSMGGIIGANYMGTYGDPGALRSNNNPKGLNDEEPFGLRAFVSLSGCFDVAENAKFCNGQKLWQPYLAYQLKRTFVGKYTDVLGRRGFSSECLRHICSSAVHDISDFDAAVPVKLYGYKGTADYYEDMSVGHRGRLGAVCAPMLAVHAADDPIVDSDTYGPSIRKWIRGPSPNPNVFVCITRTGGHVGWPVGAWPVEHGWRFMNSVTMEFCEAVLLSQAGDPTHQK